MLWIQSDTPMALLTVLVKHTPAPSAAPIPSARSAPTLWPLACAPPFVESIYLFTPPDEPSGTSCSRARFLAMDLTCPERSELLKTQGHFPRLSNISAPEYSLYELSSYIAILVGDR